MTGSDTKQGGKGKEGDHRYSQSYLVSGSLEVLIERLVPTVDYYPDRTYIFTFLLSSRIFIHPQELLAKVGQICTKQQQQLETGAEVKMKAFVPKIIQLLTEWTETFPHDFQDEKAMKELKEITLQIAQCDEDNASVKKSISQMTQSLIRKLSTHSQYQEPRDIIKPSVTDKQTILKPKSQSSLKDILSVCNDPCVVAQQLTHIEMERLTQISPEELVHIFSQMDSLDNHKSCRSDIKKTYNLEAYDNWFNRLSSLVATEICRVGKKKQRTRVVEFFIDVARECFNIGNFNSLMAIISGMNLNPVARLRKTWSKVKKAKFEVLENHMDPSSNFSHYRTALQGAAQRSQTAHSNREKVVIPVFNLFIKDIYFLNKIHSNQLPNGQINFKKFWEIAKQISEFMMWKQVDCPFEKDKKIKNYLTTAPVYTEEALYLASFESEGPENHMEKDSWKTLRATLLNRA
uniref:RasGEF domain family member 1A n=1 Tax=Callorhinchus milii TaxID=7868 RepID=A0A4W3GMQ7_CALMI